HKICVQRQVLRRGAHVFINYAGVDPPQRIAPTKTVYNARRFSMGRMSSSTPVCIPRSAPVLWERACSRIGQCSRRKQGVWAIAFASKLAPTKTVYNAKCFGVGAHVVINYAGVHPP
ncbi:hypothetical protein, partial [Pseudomonas syringae]|uniref:hypothetical protein n=1 Tax=Pseudomonas syringae TaxID=317 RepID=UPI001959DE41